MLSARHLIGEQHGERRFQHGPERALWPGHCAGPKGARCHRRSGLLRVRVAAGAVGAPVHGQLPVPGWRWRGRKQREPDGRGSYLALRPDDCDNACDVEPLWGAWGGGLGAFGTLAGDSNSHGLTYSLGGFIAGLDRRVAPGFSAGIAAGFNAASLYAQGMPGYGTSDTLQFALYGEYQEDDFYVDALAGYGHSDNRMTRPIVIAGLPFRSAQGYTAANTSSASSRPATS